MILLPCFRVFMLVVVLIFSAYMACAQNTIIPEPITATNPAFTWDSSVFSDGIGAFALGHQWGASSLDKVNSIFSMNMTNDQFGYMWDNTGKIKRDTATGLLSGHLEQLYHLGQGYHDTNYIMIGSALEGMPANHDFNGRWIGMRWEPAENSDLEGTWTPRDADSWPFSFAARHHGTIASSPSDANYRRYVVEPDSSLTYPVKILDSVMPRNQLFMWDDTVHWEKSDPLAFPITGKHPDSWDCRRLQVVVNMRRSDPTDTVVDDSVVASIVVPYQTRWKSQDPQEPDYDPKTWRMPFDSVPSTSLADTVHLPLGRGTVMKMRLKPGQYMDSLVITRRMLPLHSDPGGPDITFVAEFRTDTIIGDTVNPLTRRGHILKADKYGFVPTGKATSGMADSNKRYMAIDSLGVTLWYHGTTTGIAVRSAELVTPQTRMATSGYWDAGWSQALKTVVDSLKTIQDIVYDSTGRHLKVLGFYLPDEYDVIHLLGMRYRLEFLDRRATSETGYQGARSFSDNFRSTYGLHRLHAFPSRFLWTAGIEVRTRQTAAPYVRYPYQAGGEYANNAQDPPLRTLGIMRMLACRSL